MTVGAVSRRGRTARVAVGAAVIVAMTAGLATRGTAQSVEDAFAADAARLVRALALTAGQVVADIGAGNGELTVALARAVGPSGRVYGTELNADRLRAIRRAAGAAGLSNVTVVEGHETRTNLPAGCCDALVVRFVYHHFRDPRLMNASLRQSLRPGGRLAVIDFPPDGPESDDPAERASGAQHGVTAGTVARELREAGFEVIAVDEGAKASGYLVVAQRPRATPRGGSAPPATRTAFGGGERISAFAGGVVVETPRRVGRIRRHCPGRSAGGSLRRALRNPTLAPDVAPRRWAAHGERMPADPLEDVLVRVRSLLVDLQRHIDRGAAERDLAEVGRAWVRAAQVERMLRDVLPADVTASAGDVGETVGNAGANAGDASAMRRTRRRG